MTNRADQLIDLVYGELPPLGARDQNWRYGSPVGEPKLLEWIAKLLEVDEANVAITAGATMALVTLASIYRSRLFLLPRPYYPGYLGILGTLGVEYEFYDISPESIDVDRIKDKAIQRSTVIIWNFPHNPTGIVAKQESIEALSEVISTTDLIVICDEVYRQLLYSDSARFLSTRMLENDNVYFVGSFSKVWSLAGERVGWIITSRKNKDAFVKVTRRLTMATSVASQLTALQVALETPSAQILEEMTRRRNAIIEKVSQDDSFELTPPQGGIFAWIEIRSPAIKRIGALRFAKLLQQMGIRLPSGEEFGASYSFLRVPFSTTGSLHAIDRISAAMGHISKLELSR